MKGVHPSRVGCERASERVEQRNNFFGVPNATNPVTQCGFGSLNSGFWGEEQCRKTGKNINGSSWKDAKSLEKSSVFGNTFYVDLW